LPELASLRICRPMRLSGAAYAQVIEMDGRELCRLPNGGNWASYVEPGQHLLRIRYAWMRSNPLEIILAPGDDVRLETRLAMWTGKPSFVRTGGAMTFPPAPRPAVQVLGVRETHRSEEPIGTETRRIDNRSGLGRVTRKIRVAEEWSRMVSLDLHESHSVSGGVDWLAIRASIERCLEHTYHMSVSRREEFTEEIGVEIEPGADVTVVLTWKRIWQHGIAHVLIQGRELNVQFLMVVGVTFDQSIR
jgi:hypothetical protein